MTTSDTNEFPDLQERIAALIELGAIGVIPKPFDPIALADQINALWETNH